MLGAGVIDDMLNIFLFILVSYIATGIFLTRETILILSAVLAFFIGIMIHSFMGRSRYEIMNLERFLLVFILPFFFISMGTYFNPEILIQNPLIMLVILATAVAGKIFGTLLTKPFIRLRLKQLYLVGWGMNSRGAVELVIAYHALSIGLISTYIFSSLIVMALVTTVIFPLFIARMIKKEPKIMG